MVEQDGRDFTVNGGDWLPADLPPRSDEWETSSSVEKSVSHLKVGENQMLPRGALDM